MKNLISSLQRSRRQEEFNVLVLQTKKLRLRDVRLLPKDTSVSVRPWSLPSLCFIVLPLITFVPCHNPTWWWLLLPFSG